MNLIKRAVFFQSSVSSGATSLLFHGFHSLFAHLHRHIF
uniref:Uncharacterized protein n=1 Tax=Physcomitrium patens TaxID=3218 RepID=A0A2K1JKR3_PHYPA|nr:hypothetical protein PHYPA_016954 [Physcomitrium patens]